MIGNGSWKTKNKILPGVYIQVLSSINGLQESQKSNEPIDTNNYLLASKDGFYLITVDGFHLTVKEM